MASETWRSAEKRRVWFKKFQLKGHYEHVWRQRGVVSSTWAPHGSFQSHGPRVFLKPATVSQQSTLLLRVKYLVFFVDTHRYNQTNNCTCNHSAAERLIILNPQKLSTLADDQERQSKLKSEPFLQQSTAATMLPVSTASMQHVKYMYIYKIYILSLSYTNNC